MSNAAQRRLTDIGTIVLASHNAGKIKEMQKFFRPFDIDVHTAKDYGLQDVEETGTSFHENAALKALSAARITGLPALADDSGICLHALGEEPGIHTARWAGENKTDQEKVRYMLDRLKEQSDRSADVVCVLALAWPEGHVEYAVGLVECMITEMPRGDRGFGYDPVLLPVGSDRTFAEMTPEEKAGRSHRGRALEDFVQKYLS